MKAFKNILIIIIGLFVTIFLYSSLGRNTPEAQPTGDSPTAPSETGAATPIPLVPTPTDTKIISSKGVEIFLDTPKVGDTVTSPLEISGRAPGNWFFEASAPVVLTNWDGLIIAEGHIEAQSNWMTTDYVPFTGELSFEKSVCAEGEDYCLRGTVILQKDNPSGESQFDDAAEFSVKF